MRSRRDLTLRALVLVLVTVALAVGARRAPAAVPRIADIAIYGNRVTHEGTILREMRIRAGDLADPAALAAARASLESLDWIVYADIQEKATPDGTVVLLVQVEEADRLDLHLFGEYRRLPRYKEGFFGLGATVDNFRGRGERLDVQTGLPGELAYSVRWTVPWVLGRRESGLYVEGYWHRFDFEYQPVRLMDRGFEVGLYRHLGRIWRAELGYNHRFLRADRTPTGSPLAGDETDPTLRAAMILDTRDSRAYPRQGLRAEAELRLGGLGRGDTYGVVTGRVAHFVPVPVLGILAQRLLVQSGTADLPWYERVYLGDPTDLRGYEDGEVRGEAGLLATLELRRPLLDLAFDRDTAVVVGVHGFGDLGGAWERSDNIAKVRFERAWGAGVHAVLGGGMLRVEWARNRRGEELWTFSQSVHF